MIVVDTSVWVDAFRTPGAPVAAGLMHFIDADEACLALPVRLELAEHWIDAAADVGQRFAIIDLLIAALAHDLTALVWSLDRDFERMADLGFVRLYR